MDIRSIGWVIVVALLTHCKQNDSQLPGILLQGKVSTAFQAPPMLLNQYEDTLHSINISDRGTFKLALEGLDNGYFSLRYNDLQIPLYLAPEDSLFLELGNDHFSIEGKGANRNQYLKRKASPEFDWYTQYYESNNTGVHLMSYYRENYILKLKNELQLLNADTTFLKNEINELDHEYASQLLMNQHNLESELPEDHPIRKDLIWAQGLTTENELLLQTSENYITTVARLLVTHDRTTTPALDGYYKKIHHSRFKTHFLETLVSALHKDLQFAAYDYQKAKRVESFIKEKQPKDSIGYHIFQIYDGFEEAKGELASFNYEDIDGHMVDLSELRGKYVYIDFWATWCTYCIKEFPYLKKLEKHFDGYNISFVGISIDHLKAKDKWKKMMEDKELNNLQLFAPFQGYPDRDYIKDEFIKLAYVNAWYLGIPHYTLIDPEGKIVETYFFRPSNKKLGKYLFSLPKLKKDI